MQLSAAEASALQTRRLAFELGLSDLRVQGALIARSAPDGYPDLAVCPCCGYPTVYARVQYDICCLCAWEDDGQDDHDTDAVRGTNSGYSLTEARRNFIDHRTKSRPSDVAGFERRAPTLDVRIRLVAVFDALLPIVQPWAFISAMPDIERLQRSIHEITFGKTPRSIVPRDPSVVKREREYREWDVWALVAAQTLAPWRHSIFCDVPPIEHEKDREFERFVNAVDSRLHDLVAARRGVAPERLSSFRACTEWMRDEQTAKLSRYAGYESIGLTFWPMPEDSQTVFYRFDDESAIGDAAERIARYFGIRALRALPDCDASYSGGRAIR